MAHLTAMMPPNGLVWPKKTSIPNMENKHKSRGFADDDIGKSQHQAIHRFFLRLGFAAGFLTFLFGSDLATAMRLFLHAA